MSLPRKGIEVELGRVVAVLDVGMDIRVYEGRRSVSELGVLILSDSLADAMPITVVGAQNMDGVAAVADDISRFLRVPKVTVREIDGRRMIRVDKHSEDRRGDITEEKKRSQKPFA